MPRRPRLPPNVRRHGSGFRAVVTIDGVRQRSLTMPTVEAAQQWLAQVRAAHAQPIDRLSLTLAGGLDLVRQDLAATDARDATVRFYVNHSRPLFAGLGGGDVQVHRVTTAMLRTYIETRRATGVAASTIVNKELFVLRRIRKLALAAGYMLPVDPFVGLRTPKVRTGRFDFVSGETVAQVLAKMRATPRRKGRWHADLVEALWGLGIRRAELARMRVPDIDFTTNTVAIEGKTGPRRQPFGEALAPVLRRLVAAAQRDGRLVVSYRTVEKLFERWQKRLGVKISPHVIRHGYATHLAPSVDTLELMRLMGHSSPEQTARYYHGRDGVRAALDTLSPGPPSPPPAEPSDETPPSDDGSRKK